ncbi:MAG TPA: hypothetical protein VD833_21615 [Vicinamibacterales bacterium]|nr:hypothetical protein [Vicinamibacterales bacterium]
MRPQYLGFFAEGKIMKVRAGGDPVQLIVPVTMTARGASWGASNVIVYSQRAGGPLWRVNADGAGASVLTEGLLTDDERSHRWPMSLPDGDRFLFWAGNFSTDGGARTGIYMSSLSARQKVFLVEGKVAGVGWRWHRTTLARRWERDLLSGHERYAHGRAGRLGCDVFQRHGATALPRARQGANLQYRRIQLRRFEGRLPDTS